MHNNNLIIVKSVKTTSSYIMISAYRNYKDIFIVNCVLTLNRYRSYNIRILYTSQLSMVYKDIVMR